jgi:hypothetical protein
MGFMDASQAQYMMMSSYFPPAGFMTVPCYYPAAQPSPVISAKESKRERSSCSGDSQGSISSKEKPLAASASKKPMTSLEKTRSARLVIVGFEINDSSD